MLESNDESENLGVFLKSRKDRMGSNFMFKLGYLVYSHKNKITIYRKNDTERMLNQLFLSPIKDYTIEYKDQEFKHSPKFEAGLRTMCAKFVSEYGEDIISYFKKNFKNKFVEKIKEKTNNFELPWKDNSKIICIHLRLEDRSKFKDRSSTKDFQKYISWINNNEWNKYKRLDSDQQFPIGINVLEKKVNQLKNDYPEKEIYIITSGSIPETYNNLIKKYNIKCINNQKEDLDIWCMMNCDILVITKSTFGLIPAMYFQGSQIHYQLWPIWACLGIGTKYDKSGWVGFD